MTGGQVEPMADAGLDMGGGRDNYNARGPHRGQVISGVIASVISYIFTFIIVNCADKSIRNESMTV